MGPTLQALGNCDLFAGVTDDELSDLGLRPQRRQFKAGEIIFDRQDTSRDVYFLEKGRVLAVFWTQDGRELIFGRLGVGASFGEMAAIDNDARSLSIYANRDTDVLRISQVEFLQLTNTVETFRTNLLNKLVRQMRQMNERNYQTCALSLEHRVRAYLVRLGLEHGSLIRGGEVADAPTHLEIANSVGSNREAVSRVMSALKRSGVIEYGRQKISFKQPNMLVAPLV